MENSLLMGVSLTASFLAGMGALFAPCCITFLLPSYLGTIFKEHKKVMFYTLIFAAGLSVILLPVALGARFFIYFFDEFHKQIYYIGGVVLILMGIVTIKPFFQFPMFFHVTPKVQEKVSVGSVFGLGLISGLTSSCCAPVLFAAVTLTTLSPSLLQAFIVGGAYVAGIVFPLFFISLLYHKTTGRMSGALRQRLHTIYVIVGGSIFILAGILIVLFTYLNKIQMYQMEGYSRQMRLFIFYIGRFFQNPLIDISVFIAIFLVFYILIRKHS